MKAISIKQPWASMIAWSEKTIEVRSWSTKHRGDLLIVSSKNPKVDNLPCGQALAIAQLIDCRSMIIEDEKDACCKYYQNAYSWILKNVIKIPPFPVRGNLYLYDVDFIIS